MSLAPPLCYSVEAFNISHASENKIHDDGVARRLGFAGGLVPGAEVFAYACHPLVQHWGVAWLERGQMQCRFIKPVYDGRIAQVSARETEHGFDLEVVSERVLCATGVAVLPASPSMPPPLDAYQQRRPPQRAKRPLADEASLAQGNWLGIEPLAMTRAVAEEYLRGIRESDPIYAAKSIVHPGFLVRLCNYALGHNVVLPPWIHTGSRLANFAVAHIGDELEVRARVADNYERKGHRLVDLDVLVIANGKVPVAKILHTAVYQLRQVAAASASPERTA
jgi:acyl dehydratase